MSKQYNKGEKKKRRKAYIKRKKASLRAKTAPKASEAKVAETKAAEPKAAG